MGDLLPTSKAHRSAPGVPDMLEKSQCVLLHLSMDFERLGQGNPNRVPSKTRVHQLETRVRADAFRQAQRRESQISTPRAMTHHEFRDATHDVMSPNHDRNFHI